MNPQLATDHLQEFSEEIYLEPASTGKRFANCLIDMLVFYGLMIGFGFLVGVMAVSQGADLDESELLQESSSADLWWNLISFVLYITVYTLFEGYTKGKTVGKFITKTRAVRADGGDITWTTAFKRSLIRMIPFEVLSAFGGRPWHDTWTDTIVRSEN